VSSALYKKKQCKQGVTRTGNPLHSSANHLQLDNVDIGVKVSNSVLYLSENRMGDVFFSL